MTEKSTRVRLARSVASIPPSGIRRFFELANSAADCISLGVGEPDFVTPWRIREAAIASLEAGYTTYTANAGLPELREAIAAYLFDRFGLSYRPEDQIVVTVGASEAIDLALRAILDPGDEVLVVEPCYVSYAANVRLCGGVPVSVPTTKETGFASAPPSCASGSPRAPRRSSFPTPTTPPARSWGKRTGSKCWPSSARQG